MELVTVEPCGFSTIPVGRDAPPNLVLDHEHSQLFQLLAQFPDVVADKAVVDVHVGAVVEQVQTALDVDFKSRRHMMGFLFFLLQKGFVEVLQKWHPLGAGVVEVAAVNLVNAAVDDRFFDRQQALLAADDQFAQREDAVGLQGDGVILLRVVGVDVHGVDVVGAGWRDFDNLSVQSGDKGRILAFRVTYDNIVVCGEKCVGDFPLGCEGFSASGGAEDQAVRVFELLAVHHDKVVGEGIQAVVERARARLKQLLCRERDEDGGGAGGQRPLHLDEVLRQGQTGHEALLLLPVEAGELAVVLLGDAGRLDSFKSLSLCSRLWTKIKKQQIFSDLLLSLAAGGGWYSVLKVRVWVAR